MTPIRVEWHDTTGTGARLTQALGFLHLDEARQSAQDLVYGHERDCDASVRVLVEVNRGTGAEAWQELAGYRWSARTRQLTERLDTTAVNHYEATVTAQGFEASNGPALLGGDGGMVAKVVEETGD